MSKTNPMSPFIRDHKDSIRNPLELNNNAIKVAEYKINVQKSKSIAFIYTKEKLIKKETSPRNKTTKNLIKKTNFTMKT